MEEKGNTNCSRCGSNACFKESYGDIESYVCFGCGWTTSNQMVKGNKILKDALKYSPELHKDLKYTDEKGRVWLPATISVEDKGVVFLDGTSKNDYKWAAMKSRPLKEGEKKLNNNQSYKTDTSTLEYFEEKDFMEAVDYVGLFNPE